ncbi:TonB-dependent receptor [Hymenobacter persicinus]|uniref:TonB-dependent receptor plug domain-containing protein n=1 Tax=Hymenobacter persicinus TaxID=2025506 RepID=A0A4Q5LC53_9BACT|nr:carboxypeptidase-like regulatory domain-containing protein [Hymenobacter persicinus]RYU80267.1 hypothetical protein EWM57_08770 [Hymenobacter persicinus]
MKYLRFSGLLLAASVLLLAFRRPTPADDFVPRLLEQLTRFYATTFPEKVYLHLDKNTYAAGETLWFKAYLVEAGQHRPDTLSRVLYVDVLTPENQVLTQRMFRVAGSTAPGAIPLPLDLPQGAYTVRAYTSWMRNTAADYFFSRSITILATSSQAQPRTSPPLSGALDLQFFPEGGQLVTGLESTLAFKATGPDGRGLEVRGEIQDEQGAAVASFGSQHLGMGRLQFKPEAGRRYQAVVRFPAAQRGVYPLPAAQATGFTMRVLELGSVFQIAIQRRLGADAADRAEPITVVAHVRGQPAYVGQGQMSDANTFVARVPKDRFAAGVAHFTLFDGQHRPRCERLAFVSTDPGLRLTLQPDKAAYAPREKVTLRLAAADETGRPVAGQFSLAVNHAGLVPLDSGATDIRTYLLLEADLRGRVEAPGFYFKDRRPATAQALDNLLLTQGWRRFTWPDLLAGQFGKYPFPLEYALSVSGQVLGAKDAPAAGAPVTLFRFGRQQDISQTTTDSTGRFLFSNFDGRDTARFLVQVKPGKGLRNPTILLDRLRPDLVPLPLRPLSPNAEEQAAYLQSSRRQQAVERQFQVDGNSILLGNVTVQGTKVVVPDARRIYQHADAVIKTADIPAAGSYANVLQLLQGRVAGVSITGPPSDMHAMIRGATSFTGSNEAVYLVDGIPVDASLVNSLPVQEVESVEVLKGASAAIFGSRGAGGVIAILTKRGSPGYDKTKEPAARGLLTYALPGFEPAREFYMPKYGGKTTPPTDHRRATLYWNPDLRTDAAGQATVSFYASDETGPFRLTVEGISPAGQPGRGTAQVQVGR